MNKKNILLDAFNQKPAAAIDYLKRKGYAVTDNWFDMWKDAHARAFTAAKVAKIEVMRDIRAMVDKALSTGMTFQEFKKQLAPMLVKKGWWGKQEHVNKETGEVTEYTVGPRRLKTIYRTNLQTAYMAGRYKGQVEAAADLPYMQYLAVIDGKTRDSHRELHEKIFRADDPIWEIIYPPNGWGCRCRVRSLTKKALDRSGLTVEECKAVEGQAMVGKGDNKKIVAVRGAQLPNGKVVWAGPGWDYNAGKSAWMPELDAYHPDDARAFVRDEFNGPAYRRFLEAKGAIGGVIPVAVLPKEYMASIGAKTNTVRLSADTLFKNVAHHPEILTEDYLRLQTIIEQASAIVQDGANTMVFIEIKDKIYHAVIRATTTGKGLFMTSLRFSDKDEVKRMMKTGKVIKK